MNIFSWGKFISGATFIRDRRERTFMYIYMCGEILQRRLWIIYSSVSITASPTGSWWSSTDVDFSFLFKISLSNFSGGWYGTKALQGLLRDDLTAFTYLRKRNSGSDFSGLNCSRSLWSKIWRTSLSSPSKKNAQISEIHRFYYGSFFSIFIKILKRYFYWLWLGSLDIPM